MKTVECIKELTVSVLVERAVDNCIQHGLTPMEAAKMAALGDLPTEELWALAVVGLARMVNRAIDTYNTPSPASCESNLSAGMSRGSLADRREKAARETAIRREVLYRRTVDALGAVYVGADGMMRSLHAFTSDDHRFRLHECETKGHGWRRAARFHQESLTALKTSNAASIAQLDKLEQERLRGLLR